MPLAHSKATGMRHPLYLHRHPRTGIYSLRVVVPAYLRQRFGQREVKRSLGTRDPRLARLASLKIQAEVLAMSGDETPEEKLLRALRENPEGLRDFTLAFNPGTGRAFVREARGAADYQRGQDEAKRYNEELERAQREEQEQARRTHFGGREMYTAPEKIRLTKAWGTCRRALAGWVVTLETTQAEGSHRKKTTGIKARAVEDFIEWRERERLSDNVRDITEKDIYRFREYLMLSKAKGGAGLSGATRANKFLYLAQWFDECATAGLWKGENPARGAVTYSASAKANAAEKNGFRPFTLDELQRIFEPETYAAEMRLPHHFWPPIIALFTGARISEISQCLVDDIAAKDGTRCIVITDEVVTEQAISANGKRKSVKNGQSKRLVPIHPRIIEAGFDLYLESRKAAKEVQLFPVKLDTQNGAGNAPGKKFSRRLGSLGIVSIEGAGKVGAHSFRDTVIEQLHEYNNCQLHDSEIRRWVGHIDSEAHPWAATVSKDDAHEIAYRNGPLTTLAARCLPALNWPEIRLPTWKP